MEATQGIGSVPFLLPLTTTRLPFFLVCIVSILARLFKQPLGGDHAQRDLTAMSQDDVARTTKGGRRLGEARQRLLDMRPSADSNDTTIVQEYQPVIHRLRFSASA